MHLKTLPEVRDAAAEAPWIAYFLGCVLLCVLGLVVLGMCRLLGAGIARVVAHAKAGSPPVALSGLVLLTLLLAALRS